MDRPRQPIGNTAGNRAPTATGTRAHDDGAINENEEKKKRSRMDQDSVRGGFPATVHPGPVRTARGFSPETSPEDRLRDMLPPQQTNREETIKQRSALFFACPSRGGITGNRRGRHRRCNRKTPPVRGGSTSKRFSTSRIRCKPRAGSVGPAKNPGGWLAPQTPGGAARPPAALPAAEESASNVARADGRRPPSAAPFPLGIRAPVPPG